MKCISESIPTRAKIQIGSGQERESLPEIPQEVEAEASHQVRLGRGMLHALAKRLAAAAAAGGGSTTAAFLGQIGVARSPRQERLGFDHVVVILGLRRNWKTVGR